MDKIHLITIAIGSFVSLIPAIVAGIFMLIKSGGKK